MRIRNRSGALFTSSSLIIAAVKTGHGNGEENEFLLPLVAAVMDVQRAEDKEDEGDHGIHMRPSQNWRSALQLQRSGEGNTENQAFEVGGEGKKADCRWKGSMRNQWDNIDIGFYTQKGTQEAVLKENISSSAEKEMTGSSDEEWKLPKSGGLEIGTLWRRQKSVHGVMRKRSKTVIGHINKWKPETKTTEKVRLETDIPQEDGRKVDEKVMPSIKRYNNNNNEAEGSQCRRRNGRGWRCSQRTLVGYSLCEYHLGKGRLRSLNGNNKNASGGRVIVNNKAGSCKFKELRLIDAS